MATRRGLPIALLMAAALLAFASPASAFRSGAWDGQANHEDNGSFRDCTMLAEYKSGITLAFIISRDFEWGLVLANDKWNLEVGSVQDVTLRIDSCKPISTIAKAVDAKGLLIPLENSDSVVEAMRGGRLLTIVTDSGKVPFRLTGTRKAIALLAACVTDALETEKTTSGNTAFSALQAEPSAPADDSGGTRNRLFTGNEAARFAANLLASAGIDDYQLIDQDKNPMPNFDVVWTYDNGIVGALAGYDDMDTVDLDEATAQVMADDAKNCKGDFASGRKQNEPAATVNVRRLFTACRTGEQVLEIHYTMFKTGTGHLIQIAHIDLGDARGDLANADSPFLGGSALAHFE